MAKDYDAADASQGEGKSVRSQQLTIRLGATTIEALDDLAGCMQASAPVGVEYTRTDAFRAAILVGTRAELERFAGLGITPSTRVSKDSGSRKSKKKARSGKQRN